MNILDLLPNNSFITLLVSRQLK